MTGEAHRQGNILDARIAEMIIVDQAQQQFRQVPDAAKLKLDVLESQAQHLALGFGAAQCRLRFLACKNVEAERRR